MELTLAQALAAPPWHSGFQNRPERERMVHGRYQKQRIKWRSSIIHKGQSSDDAASVTVNKLPGSSSLNSMEAVGSRFSTRDSGSYPEGVVC